LKFKLVFMICVLYLWSAAVVSAEYYRYVDKSGVKHYTDDLSEVPSDQRPNLSVYKSIQSPPEKKTPEKDTTEAKDTLTHESLILKENKLAEEYEVLVKKNKALAEERETLEDKEYNELVTQLNSEIKQYREKRKAFKALVEQYNKQIKP